MNRKKQLLLGTVTMAFTSAALSPLAFAGDERGLSLPSRAASLPLAGETRELSPVMKKLIGESDSASGYDARHTAHNGSTNSHYDHGERDDLEDFESGKDNTEAIFKEFQASGVLGQIKAQGAYAEGVFGKGVTVGVVDGVFGVDHADLAPNIVAFEDIDESKASDIENPDSELVNGLREQFRDELVRLLEDDHGTLVAGVIAATSNGEGTQGVAPKANIVAVDIEALDLTDLGGSDFDPEAFEEVRSEIERIFEERRQEFDDASDEEKQEFLEENGLSSEEEVDDVLFSQVYEANIGVTDFISVDKSGGSTPQLVSFGDDGIVDQSDSDQFFDAIKDDNIDVFNPSLGIDDGLVAEGIDIAVEKGSQIINMSLGSVDDKWSKPVRKAIFKATDRGTIIVLSGGNEDRTDEDGKPLKKIPVTDRSSQIVGNKRTNGLALAVGVVDENNKIQFNNCGPVKERCLVAPGINITSTAKGGGTETVSGSSFSAPAVAGSLALLLDRFPTISSKDAVEILLASATDLGKKGVDKVYGHGLVNVERAMQPLGVASLPTGSNVQGAVVTLSSSKLALSGAFGDSLSRVSVLQKGLFLDGFRRPYKTNLSNRVVADTRGIDFAEALFGSNNETKRFSSGVFTTSLSLRDDDADELFGAPTSKAGLAEALYEDQGDLRAMSFSGEIAEGLTMRAGHNLTAGQQLAVDPVSGPASNLFLFTNDSLNPQHGFLGEGSGASITHQLSETTAVSVGMMSAVGEGDSDQGEGFTTQADLRHSFANESEVGLSVSFTGESSGFLGSEVGGAFADQAETSSQFVTLSGSLPVSQSIDLLGSATMGRSDLSGVNGGIIDDVDNVMTSAIAVGVTKDGIFDDMDRFGLIVSQPLRVESGGKATFLVPTSVNADGSIESARERVGLTPSGRELNLQLAYSRKLSDRTGVTTYALMRDEPGHNANADTDYGIGMRFKMNF